MILGGKGILADKLNDLIEASLLLQNGHSPFPVLQESLTEVLLVPRPQRINVQRIGIEPVNGREVPPIGKACIQRPEHLDNAHRRLRDRFGKIAAWGRYRAHGGQGAAALFITADAGDGTGTLIELCQTGGEVSRIALFTRHFLQATAHLTQRLCPTRSGIRNNGHSIAHVAVIFSNGDSGIDRSLTSCHRHIGGIGNEDGTLHQRFPGAGVNQFREFPQNIGHFIPAFPAADVDHQIHIRPLGQSVLHHCLARAERSRNSRGTALCHREEGIHNTLAGLQRHAGREFPPVRASHTNRPLLHHRQLHTAAVCLLQHRHRFGNGIAAGLNGNDLALHFGRDHDFMQNGRGLLHRTDDITTDDFITGMGGGGKFPFSFTVQRGNLHTAGQVIAAHFFHDGIQRALNSVIDIFHQAWTQLYRKG